MDPKALQKLVEQAKNDPKFFHALVFDTESVLKQLDYLDRESKAAMVAISPEQILAAIGGERAGCDVTCTSSCGATCNQSCGYTTNLTDEVFDRFVTMPTPGMFRRRNVR